MLLSSYIFYLFAAVMLGSAVAVITARNPVHSVLFLVLAFFNAAGLFILLGAEFVAMILVIVYVGAVAVLFLFVVMMLDISFAQLRVGAMRFAPIGLALGGVLLFELISLYLVLPSREISEVIDAENTNNTKELAGVLYTKYMLPFQVSGLILLVAMIGAIVLTHRARPDTRRQNVNAQVAVRARDVLRVVQVQNNAGAGDE